MKDVRLSRTVQVVNVLHSEHLRGGVVLFIEYDAYINSVAVVDVQWNLSVNSRHTTYVDLSRCTEGCHITVASTVSHQRLCTGLWAHHSVYSNFFFSIIIPGISVAVTGE